MSFRVRQFSCIFRALQFFDGFALTSGNIEESKMSISLQLDGLGPRLLCCLLQPLLPG